MKCEYCGQHYFGTSSHRCAHIVYKLNDKAVSEAEYNESVSTSIEYYNAKINSQQDKIDKLTEEVKKFGKTNKCLLVELKACYHELGMSEEFEENWE